MPFATVHVAVPDQTTVPIKAFFALMAFVGLFTRVNSLMARQMARKGKRHAACVAFKRSYTHMYGKFVPIQSTSSRETFITNLAFVRAFICVNA